MHYVTHNQPLLRAALLHYIELRLNSRSSDLTCWCGFSRTKPPLGYTTACLLGNVHTSWYYTCKFYITVNFNRAWVMWLKLWFSLQHCKLQYNIWVLLQFAVVQCTNALSQMSNVKSVFITGQYNLSLPIWIVIPPYFSHWYIAWVHAIFRSTANDWFPLTCIC